MMEYFRQESGVQFNYGNENKIGKYGTMQNKETFEYLRPEMEDTNIESKNLIVNYLPQAFSDKHLFDLFIPFGPLHSVKIMRDSKSGYSYGFGFVNFIRVEDAVEARKNLNGRQVSPKKRVKVSFARPPSDDIKDTNLYITNLPTKATIEDIGALFGKFGTIVQKNILYDKKTGLSRGKAFVRYAHRDQALSAISGIDNYVLPGSREPIRVKLALDHGKQKASYMTSFKNALIENTTRNKERN